MNVKYLKTFLIIIIFVTCAQFSTDKSSVDGNEKPSLNVSGLLTDTSGFSYKVENITISGRYKDIAVYQKPPAPDINPDVNTTKIDLCELSEIRIDKPQVFQYNKRDYVEIIVVMKDIRKTANIYLIEKSKKFFCDEVNEAGGIEKELSFLAIKRIQFQGCVKQETKAKQYKVCRQVDQTSVDLTITKTNALLKELENNASQLPNDSISGKIKSQILQTVNDLQEMVKQWFS